MTFSKSQRRHLREFYIDAPNGEWLCPDGSEPKLTMFSLIRHGLIELKDNCGPEFRLTVLGRVAAMKLLKEKKPS